MLNVNVDFEKAAVAAKHTSGNFLIKMTADDKNTKSMKNRKKLNISLSIDCSPSMDFRLNNKMNQGLLGSILNNGNQFPVFHPNNFEQLNVLAPNAQALNVFAENKVMRNNYNVNRTTRFEKAKEVAIALVNSLEDGDIFSLVQFAGTARVIIPATEMNSSVKASVITAINSIRIESATNVYEGWEKAAQEVAKFVSEERLNRVVMLTDGETNTGITNIQEIVKRVNAITAAKIQTSTIGIGDGFQEDLLSSMAEQGEGNFYFVENEDDFSSILKSEINGMQNTVLSNVELKFISEGDTVFSQLNGFKVNGGVVKVPNIARNKETKIVCDFDVKQVKKIKSNTLKIGAVEISAINVNGKKVTYTEELFVKILTNEDYVKMPSDGAVTVEIALVKVAMEQAKASDLILKGKAEAARNVMRDSVGFLKTNFADNEKLMAMSASIQGAMERDDNNMSKVLRSQSYSSRYGFDDEGDKK